ncbi:hypothetical protein [Crocinitomix catalasitica]|uniref:hypothetical protein n=1 Tax=Crocinitomix catalasitica TaxID=184607 RepID=UPI00048513A0|nr:hypothetical protein [Crocinitomix catalasitica]
MKRTITILSILIFSSVYAQQTKTVENFNCLIRHSLGDVNNDGILDLAIISTDTVNDTRPLKLQIFFGQPNGDYELFFSSVEMITPMYPAELNGEHNGSQIPDVYLEDGNLLLDFYIEGNSRYTFVLKDGVFELVDFSYVNWDGKHITEVEFDLLTGRYTKQKEILNSHEIILQIEQEVLIRPLPQLEGFKPFTHDLY